MSDLERFIEEVPKAELHVHLFGTLTPEMLLEKAKKNNIEIPFKTVEEARAAYIFKDLASFIQMYDLGASVFKTRRDFFDITHAYLKKCSEEGIKYVELIYDPQSHAPFGVKFEDIHNGIHGATVMCEEWYGIKSKLILCIVRHMDTNSASRMLYEHAGMVKNLNVNEIVALGLGGIEKPFPPRLFQEHFAYGRDHDYKLTAHCGEEADASYIKEALELLYLDRIDHGINCEQDPVLVDYLVKKQIPMTICPISNVKIGLFKELKDHNVKRLLDKGLNVSLHSDDPSYFNAYLLDVYKETAKALNLSIEDIAQLAKNSFRGAFISDKEKDKYCKQIDKVLRKYQKCLLKS